MIIKNFPDFAILSGISYWLYLNPYNINLSIELGEVAIPLGTIMVWILNI